MNARYSDAEMEEFYGKNWKEYQPPLNCPYCNTDLRDLKNGPPYKRELGIYSRELDRTVAWQCPDCEKEWPRWVDN